MITVTGVTIPDLRFKKPENAYFVVTHHVLVRKASAIL